MKSVVAQLVSDAIAFAIDKGELALNSQPDPAIERPRDPSHGDWATTVALRLAKEAGMAPRDIAGIIKDNFPESKFIDSVEIAGPGFLNVRLSHSALTQVLKDINTQDSDFGRNSTGEGSYTQIEFVSANPVGPMHIGHGRWAALGDSIARILEHCGYRMQREFYINDAGVQMDVFGRAIEIRLRQLIGEDVELEEGSYPGEYIIDIARELLDLRGESILELPEDELHEICREFGYKIVLANIKETLEEFGVNFDVYFSERILYKKDEAGDTAVTRAIKMLEKNGYIYEKEGALWFETTRFEDDKDRVLIKADGDYTYFAADIAYHFNKFERGMTDVINIWGADHHGYVKRMEAAVAALGHPGKLRVIIGQLVNLIEDGEAVRLSKRAGKIITFEELIEEVGVDAARYGLLRRSTDQRLDFDVALAKEKSNENPVYYVQYAHARICSILRRAFDLDAEDTSVSADELSAQLGADPKLELLSSEAELALVRKLSEFPELIEIAGRDLAPHKLATYIEELAGAFHHFYAHNRVMDDDAELRTARLYLSDATRRVLRLSLNLVGISAPERM